MSLIKWLVPGCVAVLFAIRLCAEPTNSTPPIAPGFLKTNGDFVTIGDIMIKTNSPGNTTEFKQYMWRVHLLHKIMDSRATNATDLLVAGSWALVKDYPDRPNGYQAIMAAMEDYEYLGTPAKAKELANEMITSTAPEYFKMWAKGFLNRLNSTDKPVSLQFTAVDGRKVDLASMRGHVVLVDFWATDCGPCVEELPMVKAAYDRFHPQGLEIIGISCDTDREKLTRFTAERGYPWPQYFDGQQQERNQFTQGFGIDGIPHMFLIDKKGILRFDNVRAGDNVHTKGDTLSFEEKISKLLAEN